MVRKILIIGLLFSLFILGGCCSESNLDYNHKISESIVKGYSFDNNQTLEKYFNDCYIEIQNKKKFEQIQSPLWESPYAPSSAVISFLADEGECKDYRIYVRFLNKRYGFDVNINSKELFGYDKDTRDLLESLDKKDFSCDKLE